MVGCVIVYEGKVIAEGYHQQYGGPHAEVNAINNVSDKSILKDCTLYVNLEPCAHFGKTPPCADLITKHQVKEVFIGCVDSFSEVSGKGIEKMESAGIDVKVGGQISIDIYPRGLDKAQSVEYVRDMYGDCSIVFFGDRTDKDGNDYSVTQVVKEGDVIHPVESDEDTYLILESYMGQDL